MENRANLHRLIIVTAVARLPMAMGPAFAADLPADCSQATIPDQPIKGQIAGKEFIPDSATFSTINHPQIGGASYDSFDLYLRGKDQTGQTLRSRPEIATLSA